MRGIAAATKELITYAYRLLEADHPMTLRQLHYAIFSKREISYENTQADYKRLSRATTMARRKHRSLELTATELGVGDTEMVQWAVTADGGAIPGEWMIDETRQPEMVSVWTDSNEYIETVKRAYRRDNWQDQPSYCEVWSEKATILGSVRPITEKWGITVRVCHGFGSTGMEGQVGRCFEDIQKPITVFFLGDHDPSGHVIEADIHARSQNASGLDFSMERLAIHAADIAAFNLPPQRIKASDSRASGFKERFGQDAATIELDALPASELRRRVESAITGLVENDSWSRQVAAQQIELDCIAEFADRMKNLPQAGPEARA